MHRFRLAVLTVSLLVATGGCTETSPQSVDDAWVLEGDSGSPDARADDTETPADTGGPDISVSCGDYSTRTACRAQSDCRWEGSPCSQDPDLGRCVDEDRDFYPPDCPPPRPCSEIEESQRCTERSDCSWTSKTCPDGSMVGACGGPADGRPKLECPETSCADRAPERCADGTCSTVAPGCASDNPPQFDGETCLPEGTCESDTGCQEGLTCMLLAIDPDCERCGACALGRKKCVPQSWSGGDGETGCRQLDTEVCRETDRCRMVYPSSCNEKAPEGSETFQQPTCLPAETCGDGQGCRDGFTCEHLWTGCGPTAFCSNCGSEENRCLRTDR